MMNLSLRRLLYSTIFLATTLNAFAQPTDNPIASFYNGAEGYPAWTDEIKWNNVYNVATQDYAQCASCTNDFEKFNYIRDIAYNAGGGVLYYPAGTYNFDISDAPNSEGLMLKKGVVIRGEKPGTDGRAVLANPDILTMSTTDHGLNNLPTKFKFATTRLANDTLAGAIAKMWNCIGIKSGANETGLDKVEKVGVAYIEIEYGYVYFGFATEQGYAVKYDSASLNWTRPTEPWKSGRSPDGTHPMDWFAGNKGWGQNRLKMGTKRFVFGVHVKQGGVPNYVLSHGMGAKFYCEDGPYWFGSKISIYGSNVLVANNVISKPTKCFKIKVTTAVKKVGQSVSLEVGSVVEVPYDFGKGLSIDVNKNYVAGFKNNSAVDDLSSQYTPNVLIMDNWVYNHSSKGFDIAGGWMVVRNNINRRERLAYEDVYGLGLTTFYGVSTSSGRIWSGNWNDDFLARAFTVSSRNAWYHKNQWINTGTAFDNSGEGILHQDHLNGSECYSAALTYNRGNSYTGVWNSLALGFFLGYNQVTSDIMLAAVTARCSDISSVDHKDLISNSPCVFKSTLSTDPLVMDFKSWNCAITNPIPGTPLIEAKDTLNESEKSEYVKITWSDVTDEAGYRIQKRKVSLPGWTTIAYRPRQESGSVVSFNGQAPSIFVGGGHGSDAWDGVVRDMNPKEWRDYLCDLTQQYFYRVVAIGCGDTDEGRSDSIIVGPIAITPLLANKNLEISVYPVPSSEYLNVSSENLSGGTIRILNIQGKEIISLAKVNNKSTKISTKNLNTGIYLIQIQGKSGVSQKRFTVQ